MENDELSLDELAGVGAGMESRDANLIYFVKNNQEVYNNLNERLKAEVDSGFLSDELREYLESVQKEFFRGQKDELAEEDLVDIQAGVRRL